MMKRKLQEAPAAPVQQKKAYQPSQVVINSNQRAFLQKLWADLKAGVRAIYGMQFLTQTYQAQLYTMVYDHCVHGFSRYDAARQQLCRGRIGETILFTGGQIYEHLEGWIKQHLSALIKDYDNTMANIANRTREEVWRAALKFYVEQWNNFSSSSDRLNRVFVYLNRSFVAPQHNMSLAWCGKVYEVNKLAVLIWRNTLFEHLKSVVCNAALHAIKLAREEMPAAETEVLMYPVTLFVASLLEMGVDPVNTEEDLSVYQRDFEVKLIDDTGTFYREAAAKFLKNPANSKIDYMKKVECCMNTESVHCRRYCHPSSERKVISVLRKVLIEDQLDLLHGEFRPLLESVPCPERDKNLQCLLSLIMQLDQPEMLAGMVELYRSIVTLIGRQELENENSKLKLDEKGGATVFVDTVMKHLLANKKVVQDVFQKDTAFKRALYLGMKEILKENVLTRDGKKSKSAEMIVRHCDGILKGNTKKWMTEGDLEEEFTNMAELYLLLENKDVFMHLTLQSMANRLAQRKSTSDDAESLWIEKLGAAGNNKDATKLPKLFKEYKLSQSISVEFNARMKLQNISFGFEFDIQVISSAIWPFQQDSELIPPRLLEAPLTEFKKFYSTPAKDANGPEMPAPNVAPELPAHLRPIHEGRALIWIPSRFSGEICYFPPLNPATSYTFEASGYQMAILLLFETRDSFTISDIMAETSLSLAIVQQIVQTFLKCKLLVVEPEGCKVFVVEPEGANLDPSIRVSLFQAYKNKKTRLNINVPINYEVKKQEEQLDKTIQLQRSFAIQALIVRLMKQFQECRYRDILTAVIDDASKAGSNISFMPQPRAVLVAFELLVDQSILERDEKQRDLIRYLA